jgi:aspartate oxidase
LVSGGRTDSDTLAARSLIIRAAASAMARRSEGEVLLDHRDEDRFGMQALADTVAIMVRGTGVDVRCAPLPASPMPVSIPAAPAPQPALARVA